MKKGRITTPTFSIFNYIFKKVKYIKKFLNILVRLRIKRKSFEIKYRSIEGHIL